MCQTCINCGKCQGEVRPKPPAGTCPMCGSANAADAALCAMCGAPLPKPAGVRSNEATNLALLR